MMIVRDKDLPEQKADYLAAQMVDKRVASMEKLKVHKMEKEMVELWEQLWVLMTVFEQVEEMDQTQDHYLAAYQAAKKEIHSVGRLEEKMVVQMESQQGEGSAEMTAERLVVHQVEMKEI